MKSRISTLLILLIAIISYQAEAQLLAYNFIKNVSLGEIPTVPGVKKSYSVDVYTILYNTVSLDGELVTASGIVAIPQTGACNSFPLGVYCHGTVLEKFNVPSRGTESEIPIIFASSGFIGIAPDYLGLGDSPGLHPYLHAESEATATINMIRATQKLLDEVGLEHNNETFITGYSQGGHVAMATLKYAQDHDLLDELGIIAGAPCSGSYNLTEYQVEPIVFQDLSYKFLGYGIYLILGYQNAYGNLYNDLSEIFKEEYIEDITLWFDGQQDNYSIGYVNGKLPDNISKLMQEDYLEAIKSDRTHPLWEAVSLNDNFDWKPDFPLRMFYCDGDEQVHYLNSISAEEAMNEKGAEDVKAINVISGANHSVCALPALVSAYEFFLTYASPCETTAVKTERTHLHVTMYPNPGKETILLSASEPIKKIEIYNLTAQLHQDITVENVIDSYKISITDLSPGLFFIRAHFSDGRTEILKLVKE